MDRSPNPREALSIIVVTGLSGSGKSTGIRALEDLGFFCIDNLPVALMPKLAELAAQSKNRHVALVMDARERGFVDQAAAVFRDVRSLGHTVHVLYLHADTDTLVRRYSETRRRHPMAPDGSVVDGIHQEIKALAPIRHLADQTIDTTNLTVHDLKKHIQQLYAPSGQTTRTLVVNVMSFGFKRGLPKEADLVFDVRFLDNPYFVERLRPLSGRSPDVADYVLRQPTAQHFLALVYAMVDYLLPLYQKEGKTYLTVAIGCTGGQHRSVAIAEAVTGQLRKSEYTINVSHRDMKEAPVE